MEASVLSDKFYFTFCRINFHGFFKVQDFDFNMYLLRSRYVCGSSEVRCSEYETKGKKYLIIGN